MRGTGGNIQHNVYILLKKFPGTFLHPAQLPIIILKRF